MYFLISSKFNSIVFLKVFYVIICLRYGAPDVVFKPIMSTDAKHVDVDNQFTNEQEFVVCDHMLQWIRTEVAELGFDVVIGR